MKYQKLDIDIVTDLKGHWADEALPDGNDGLDLFAADSSIVKV